MPPTMVAEVVAGTLVMVDAVSGVAEADWRRALELVRAGQYDRVLVIAQGPPLDSTRRNELRTAIGEHNAPGAIVTASKMVEAVVSILNLFFKNATRAFAPDRLDDALAYLGLQGTNKALISSAVERLRGEVAGRC